MESDSSMTMSMDGDTPDSSYLQKVYWAFVGTAIGVATMVNVINILMAQQRMSNEPAQLPAMPKTILSRFYATVTAIIREISSARIALGLFCSLKTESLILGRVAIVATNLVVVLVLCFYRLDASDPWHWEDVAYRTGYITVAQLPLVVLLAGKKNVIGLLIGSSYERLNWLHRWVARTIFLTATIHMGFWFRSWARYNYIEKKLRTDSIAARGLAAWCILLWILLFSFRTIRRWNYEIFVVHHVLTFVGFLAAVYLHLPSGIKVYVWLPIGIYIFDRILRWALVVFTNLAIFHPSRRRLGRGLFTCKARITSEHGEISRVVIDQPPFKWKPGQHVRLCLPGVALLQWHPFTIASLPEDGAMQFLIKAQCGATRKIHIKGQKGQRLPTNVTEVAGSDFVAILDGPYGCLRPLPQFDSIMLIAGGGGASFVMPLVRDIVNRWTQSISSSSSSSRSCHPGIPARFVKLIWVIKSRLDLQWFAIQISQILNDTRKITQTESLDVDLTVSVYITCDEEAGLGSQRCSPQVMLAPSSDIAVMSDKAEPNGKPLPLSSTKVLSESEHSLKSEEKSGKSSALECWCREVVEEETSTQYSKVSQQHCCCNNGSTSPKVVDEKTKHKNRCSSHVGKGEGQDHGNVVLSSGDLETKDDLLSASLKANIGRPHCRNLMRRFLEQARGESAVVVCGPQGLNKDVRDSVVTLSDERAVHKGTGAQGIYFWEEGFSY